MKKLIKRILCLVLLLILLMESLQIATDFDRDDLYIPEEGVPGSEWVSNSSILPVSVARLRTSVNLAFGNRVINGVYIGESHLAQADQRVSESAVAANKEILNSLVQKDADVYLMVFPKAYTVYSGEPSVYASAVNELQNISGITALDTRQYFAIQAENSIYYRTKDGITSLGGYYAYLSSAYAMGFQALTKESFHIRYGTTPYYGQLSRISGYYEIPRDVSYYYYPANTKVTAATLIDDNGVYLWNDRIFERLLWLEENNGEFWTADIETDSKGGSLLLIADDEGVKLLPFLICHYSSITVISTDCGAKLAGNRMGSKYDSIVVAMGEDYLTGTQLFAQQDPWQ